MKKPKDPFENVDTLEHSEEKTAERKKSTARVLKKIIDYDDGGGDNGGGSAARNVRDALKNEGSIYK